MKILFCVSEAVPLAKTGGLADVGGALPAALAAVGCDVRVVLPRYRSVSERGWRPVGTVEVSSGGEAVSGTILDGTMPETAVPIWLVDQPKYFDRSGLYGEAGRDYPDNLVRFAFFCRAVLAWVGRQSWKPDLIHCNDWQTALIPPLIRAGRAERTPTMLTIHNLAYQGLFPAQDFALTDLPASFFTMAGLEFWGQVNVLKGGLVFADTLTTVSETYAREIQTEEFGAGLDGVLRDRARDLWGILNGVDYRVWDPSHDSLIPAQYSAEDLTGKRICKEHLQREFSLYERPDIPIVGMVTRLVDQKGLDLVEAALDDLFALGVQFVVLGAGDPRYEQVLGDLPRRYPKRAGVRVGFDNALAHRIEAGADLFLMPSRYEPSGLNQLYSLRYGTVPVVRHTGGLADSIVDTTPDTLAAGTANGFAFVAYEAQAMLEALRRALDTFRTPHTWRRVQKTGMAADFSWTASARKYHALYDRTLAQSVRPGKG
ncbi:MAG TPA: glycogen synthase GlgA [bacterium]